MEVKYTIEGRDYWSFSTYTLVHTPAAWARWLFITALLPCAFAFLTTEWLTTTMVRLAAIAGVTVVWLIYRIFNARCSAYRQAAGDSEERQISITISEDGLEVWRKTANGWLTWKNIAQMAQTGEYIYLFFNRAQAVIIPKRAFASLGEAAAFYSLAARYKANPKAAPIGSRGETAIPPGALTIDYELTLEDYAQYHKERMAGIGLSRTIFAGILVVLLIGLGSVLTAASIWGASPERRPDLSVFAYGLLFIFLGAGVVWIRSPWYYRHLARRIARSVPGLIGRQTISLLPNALVRRSSYGETSFSWSDLSQVVDGAHTISISQRTTAAFIIPKRAFATDSDAIAFLHAAREYLNRVKSGVYSDPGDLKDSWPPAPTS